MKDSEGLKLLSASSCLAVPSIMNCLTHLPPLRITPTSPKGTPGVARSHCHYDEPQVRFPLTSEVRAESGAEHSAARRQTLHLPFHSEYTQGAQSTHVTGASHTSPGEDWLLGVVTTNRQAQ